MDVKGSGIVHPPGNGVPLDAVVDPLVGFPPAEEDGGQAMGEKWKEPIWR